MKSSPGPSLILPHSVEEETCTMPITRIAPLFFIFPAAQ